MKRTIVAALLAALTACAAPRAYDAPRDPQPPRTLIVAQADSATASDATPQPSTDQTYTSEEIAREASQFFGETSENLAKAIERTFSDHGRPTAYILGREGGGAAVVGVRYGEGVLRYKGGDGQPVYWQGPTIGWDFGGSASKVFTLVYNLRDSRDLFQRFPAVDGSLYVVAGFSVNYQRSGDIVLAPIRTGVGLRAGASLGYIHYTRERSFIPF
ncbi:MAG: DUF1134 domain-containing protein [Sinimarinibacterium sp.]|jgi:hypothetical protein